MWLSQRGNGNNPETRTRTNEKTNVTKNTYGYRKLYHSHNIFLTSTQLYLNFTQYIFFLKRPVNSSQKPIKKKKKKNGGLRVARTTKSLDPRMSLRSQFICSFCMQISIYIRRNSQNSIRSLGDLIPKQKYYTAIVFAFALYCIYWVHYRMSYAFTSRRRDWFTTSKNYLFS